ncbi:MAG: SH3 domain-containing protein [Pseudomonadota bacterium]
MKKGTFLAIALIAAAVAATPAFGRGKGGGGGGKSGTMSVQVREAIVRTTPNYMGGTAGTLSYGAQVNVEGEEGNWYRIASPAGFLPKSALTSHKVAVNPDSKGSGRGASHDEVALAGKGFNPQVEAQYKKSNAEVAAAYAIVDRVEQFGAGEAAVKAFQAAGKLKAR